MTSDDLDLSVELLILKKKLAKVPELAARFMEATIAQPDVLLALEKTAGEDYKSLACSYAFEWAETFVEVQDTWEQRIKNEIKTVNTDIQAQLQYVINKQKEKDASTHLI